jgi:hypothetical protein
MHVFPEAERICTKRDRRKSGKQQALDEELNDAKMISGRYESCYAEGSESRVAARCVESSLCWVLLKLLIRSR